MRRYGRIQGLVLALGRADFYRDVARNWRGIGLSYVVLVIMLTWIPILAKMQSAVGRFVEELPELSIQKGIASSPVAQPFVILKDDLDRPLPSYGPDPVFPDKYGPYKDLADDPRWKKITPRMCLTHSTGFSN